jgi:hypothetical protein
MTPKAFTGLIWALRENVSIDASTRIAVEIDPRTRSREMASARAVRRHAGKSWRLELRRSGADIH